MMKALNNYADAALCRVNYESPEVELVEISVERGFELSNEAGFQGPSYDEEDIVW